MTRTDECPECGAPLKPESGCFVCTSKDCGWSECNV